MDLKGRCVLLTGASRGIGAATAVEFAKAGANLVLCARNHNRLSEVAASVRDFGVDVETLAVDVARFSQVAAAVSRAVERFGGVHVAVNNAGLIDPIARILDSEPDAWCEVIDVNVAGVYHVIRTVAPVMVGLGGGVIVNISSGAATSALEGWSHYCASKAAVLALTKCAHKELSEHGIRVVGLSPGTVATDMQRVIKTSGINPVSTLDWSAHISPEWAARAIVYLTSDDAADLAGDDFALRSEDARRRVGLI